MQSSGQLAAGAATFVLLLSGCTASEPPPIERLSIDEGVPHYRSLTRELTSVLSAKFPTVEWNRESTESLELDRDGRVCEFYPASYKSKQGLEAVSPAFTEVMATVNPVLEKFHFTRVEKLSDVPGGWTTVKSKDRHGAEVNLSAKGNTLLVLEAPLKAGDCDADLPPYGP